MSWLKKVGQIALAVGKNAPMVGGIVSALIPGTKDDALIERATGYVDPIVKAITDVEAIGAALTLPGDQKLAAATVLVTQAMAPYVHRFGVNDPVLFSKGAQQIAQGYVDVLNSLKAPQ